MSPEERILTNDNSIRTILDLRNALKKRETLRQIREKNQS